MADNRTDAARMSEALILARQGEPWTSPNPMVGAVIYRGGELVGSGFHEKFGRPHAEVNALKEARGNVQNSTLYVNLEPCSYTGKTPPCTSAIIEAGVSRIVAAMEDPNPLVSGRGFDELKKAGVQVDVGLMESEALRLNERFVKFMKTGIPFITLKAAQTLDGRIADASGGSKWITSAEARKRVHTMRAAHDAVLVGSGTVYKDDPRLNVRSVDGSQPHRVILDLELEAPLTSCIFNDEAVERTTVFCSVDASKETAGWLEEKGVEVVRVPSEYHRFALPKILDCLAAKGISSVLVEGGSHVFSTFLEAGFVDRLLMFVNPSILGGGLETFDTSGFPVNERLMLRDVEVEHIGGDLLIQGIPDWRAG